MEFLQSRCKKALTSYNLGSRLPEVLTTQFNHEHDSKMLINKPRPWGTHMLGN